MQKIVPYLWFDKEAREAAAFYVSVFGWEKLSAIPEAEQCGWLKDKFGVSWQIVPKEMDEWMAKVD